MKNSFSLFEIILSIVISSVVIVYSMFYAKELIYSNKKSQEIEIKKTNLLATKYFIQKHKNEISEISYINYNLYYKGSLLLEDVKEFNIKNENSVIKIFINYDNDIKQNWEF